jgi:signal peptidase I
MTELNLGLGSHTPNPTGNQSKQQASVARKVVIAAVASLLVPGLGQVYAKRPWRGLVMALSLTAVVFLTGEFRFWTTFVGLISFLLVSILFRLYIVVEAGYLATTRNRLKSSGPRNSRVLAAAMTIIVLLLGAYPAPDYLMRRFSYFRAFKVPSVSMCPTVCEGERIVAEMDAFLKSGPGRGDVILMKHETSDALFLKRVIGVGGDLVSARAGAILVNGQALARPEPLGGCRATTKQLLPNDELPFFDPVKVPPSSFFVIGDNWPNSYDSRIPGFGFVTPSQVRGRPIFIYWSSTHTRIGCTIR